MIIYVKNMICLRCKIVVNNILAGFGVEAEDIMIGKIQLKENLSNYKLRQLDAALKETGLELIFDRDLLIAQKIKTIVSETIHFSNEPLLTKFSYYLSSKLNYSYAYLANVFKKTNGISIERYIILQKIEKVKAMLIAEDAALSEIAYQMNYSSVSHLSAQFKKVTGINASEYKLLRLDDYSCMPVKIAV